MLRSAVRSGITAKSMTHHLSLPWWLALGTA
jgi:hypothetical protein